MVVVGGGPAGLAAAVELRARGVAEVLVLEREAEAGGIPRHAHHQGFGLRDLQRAMSGPRYARRYAELAARAGAPSCVTEAMVTGLDDRRARSRSPARAGARRLEPRPPWSWPPAVASGRARRGWCPGRVPRA